ncbi:MAG: PD40 domain-containing protein [Chloroflexi bacterium]|nr:PD40 domain-containing protein [Chloroflexota bacterium]
MRTRVALVFVASVALAACGHAGPSVGQSPAGSGAASVPSASPGSSSIVARPTGQIAFVRPETAAGEGQVDIYLVDAGGGEAPVRLTNDARVEEAIYWLLDGSALVYAWSTYLDPYHQTLTSIRTDGAGAIDLGPVQTIYSPSAVSPDGRYVAFGGDGSEDGSSGLVLLDLADGARRQLTAGGETQPIWSPDGSRILAFLPSRGLTVIGGTSGQVMARIDDPGIQWLVGWTGDGLSILYHSCGSDLGKTECMDAPTLVANADGTNVRTYDGPLPPDPNEPQLASPDRQWIATWADGTLRVAPATGGGAIELAPGDSPAWSRDSMWLVFRGIDAGPTATSGSVSRGLFTVRRDGGQPIQLTDGASDEPMAWQP